MKWILYAIAGVVGLLVISAGTLLILGSRADANVVRASIDIGRSPREVWTWVTEPDKVKSWIGWVVDIRPASVNAAGVGAKETWVMADQNNGGKHIQIENTRTEFVPPQRLKVALKAAEGFTGEQAYSLTDLGQGRTRLSVEGRYRLQSSFARLLMPVIVNEATKKLQDDLARLKSKAEAAPSIAASN